MRIGLTVILVCCVCAGCCRSRTPQPLGHDLTVWRSLTNGQLCTHMERLPFTERETDRMLRKASYEWSDLRLIVCLAPGVSITNAFVILEMAERHGITNVVIRMNQTKPRFVGQDGHAMYDTKTEEAPTSKRTVP